MERTVRSLFSIYIRIREFEIYFRFYFFFNDEIQANDKERISKTKKKCNFSHGKKVKRFETIFFLSKFTKKSQQFLAPELNGISLFLD